MVITAVLSKKNLFTRSRKMSRKVNEIDSRLMEEAEFENLIGVMDSLFKEVDSNITAGDLLKMQVALEVVLNVVKRGVDIHNGLQVPWSILCCGARLSPGAKDMKESQDKIEKILSYIGVGVTRQDNWTRGAALPNCFPIRDPKSKEGK